MAAMNMQGLQPEQAPPLALPATFFLTAPLALLAAAVVMIAVPHSALTSTSSGATLGIIHLGTLGFLSMVMFGALYQMIPVVAGIPVAWPALARLTHLLLTLTAIAVATALLGSSAAAFWLAIGAGVAMALLFSLPLAWALLRAPTRHDSVSGMRIALAGLLGVVTLGLIMAYGRAGPGYFTTWLAWRTAHAALGFVVWIGTLIGAVSWQVVPMFYLAPELPRWSRRLLLAGTVVTLVAVPLLLAARPDPSLILWLSAPGAAAVWLLHPATILYALFKRRRKRTDPSMTFWRLAMVVAPCAFAAGIGMAVSEDARAPLLFGWLVLWGWAAAVVHGMLGRILPFLVWFHRYAPLVGTVPTPPMRRLLPDRQLWWAFAAHATTLLLGLLAIWQPRPVFVVACGASLATTALLMLLNWLTVLRHGLPRRAGLG